MKTWLLLMSAASLSLATPALAQDTQPAPVPQAPMEQSADQPMAEPATADPMAADATEDEAIKPAQQANEMVGSWLVGTVMVSLSGESVGAIQDILVNVDTGEITGVVAGVGGFLGIGAKAIAVDWDRLTINYDGYEVTTDLTREEAEAAPEYQFRDREMPPPTPASDLSPDMSTDMGTNMDAPMSPADPDAESTQAQ